MRVYPVGSGVVIGRYAIDVPTPQKGKIHIVTHAHWDHMQAARRVPALSSEETSIYARIRGVELYPTEDIMFLHAGHIPGSNMVYIPGSKDVLVTGDFKLESDIVVRGSDVEGADILLMDTTFGTPQYVFPPRRDLYKLLMERIRRYRERGMNVVLLAYELGKAQEMTALLNSYGIVPYVTETIHKINAAIGLKDRMATMGEGVYIFPPRMGDIVRAMEVQNGIPHISIRVSGWNSKLPISSHADWKQTVEFVEQVSPEMVLTYGANARESAHYLRREGFNAKPLLEETEI